MATRTRRTWKLDSQGQYSRQIGWKISAGGKRVQHKFRLGKDLQEAQRREQRLREVWEVVEKEQSVHDAQWTPQALSIAKQIANGSLPVKLPPHPGESSEEYASRIHLTQGKYPTVGITAEDPCDYKLGALLLQSRHEVQLAAMESSQQMHQHLLNDVAKTSGVFSPSSSPNGTSNVDGVRLHEAMDAFVEWIKKEYDRPALGRVNDSGLTMVRQVGTLKERHADVILDHIKFDAVEEMFRYWRRRPFKKNAKVQMTRVSAENYLGLLKRFLKWLHHSKEIAWRKPEDFEQISTRVDADHDVQHNRLEQVQTFDLDELAKLNECATSLERVFVLLALNCGFGVKEIATLTVKEVLLFQGHDKRECEKLGYVTTNADSFVKRIRRKSGVYGEWILFPQTVKAMEWALERRRSLPEFNPDAPLLLNSRGEAYDKPTAGNHRNQQIPNRFADLTSRVQAKYPDFPKLSFGKLRKTAGDLVRQNSNGEIAGVFLCHDRAVKGDPLADVYTNRPFGKVFAVIRELEILLKPVFDAAGPNPFQ